MMEEPNGLSVLPVSPLPTLGTQVQKQEAPQSHDSQARHRREAPVNGQGKHGTRYQPSDERTMRAKPQALNQNRHQDSPAVAKGT